MKKRIFALFIAMFTFFSVTANAYVYKATINDNYDFGDHFCRGVTVVHKDDMSAVIDIYGNVLIPFDERVKFLCSNGLIQILGKNEKYAYFDRYGNQLTEFVYDAFFLEQIKQNPRRLYRNDPGGDGKSDLIPVSREHKFGYLNSKGEEQIPLQFEYAYGFHDGVAMICSGGQLSQYGTYTGGKYGYLLENGEILKAPDTYWAAHNFKDGYAKTDYDVIDKNGNDIYTYNYNYSVQYLLDGYMVVTDASGMWAVMDMNQNIIIPFDYSMKELAGGEAFIVDQKIIKNAQNQIIYTAPEGVTLRGAGGGYNVYPFIQTNMVVGPYHILKGLIDANGNSVLNTKFEYIHVYGDGLIYAYDSEHVYFYDYGGKQICTVHGNDAYYYGDGFLGIREFDTKSWGYIPNPLIYPKVFIKDKELVSDVLAEIENDRTFLPMRAIFESLGAKVLWDDTAKTVTATKDDTVITITIGENVLYKNNEVISIDAPAKIENSRTLVPVRAVAEALDCYVFWNRQSRQVIIWEFDEENPHDKKIKEYAESKVSSIQEMIQTPYGTVLLMLQATPHGGNPRLCFIDNEGNEHALYKDAPRESLFRSKVPDGFQLSEDQKVLRYEVSFPSKAVDRVADGEEFVLHEAGTYHYEVNLETGEEKLINIEPLATPYFE